MFGFSLSNQLTKVTAATFHYTFRDGLPEVYRGMWPNLSNITAAQRFVKVTYDKKSINYYCLACDGAHSNLPSLRKGITNIKKMERHVFSHSANL